MASKGQGRRSTSEGEEPKPTLRLVRTEPAEPGGILLVYESHGKEHTWLLEHTSSMEFMALLMKGQFKQGRRVVVEAEVALEPPGEEEERPHLCFMAGAVESCVPVDRPTLNGLRRDIDRFLAEQG